MRAVSYNTEHLSNHFSTQSLFSLTYQPHKSLHNEYKSYPWGIFLFPKGWEQTHTCCFILQTMWWIFYEVWSSVTSMKETLKEGWVSALSFILLWFTFNSSKLTFTHVLNRRGCGHTYPQEIRDLYGNTLYCVTYICFMLLKREKVFSSKFRHSWSILPLERPKKVVVNIFPEQKGLISMDWELGQVKFQITESSWDNTTDWNNYLLEVPWSIFFLPA